MISSEPHGRVKVDRPPKQCAKCRDCRDRRIKGEAEGAEEFDINVEPIPIEAARPGTSLVVLEGGHALLFQVENQHFEQKQGEPGVITLESERVDGGVPWKITGQLGQMVAKVTYKW